MNWQMLWKARWGNPGSIEHPSEQWQADNLVWVDIPFRMDNAYDGKADDATVTRIRFHRKEAAKLERALWNVIYAAEAKVRETTVWAIHRQELKRNFPDQTTAFYDNRMAPWVRDNALKLISSFGGDVFSGSWVHRYTRGYEKQKLLSPHAWGVALDIDHKRNPMGKKLITTFPQWYVDAWKKAGFTWGGDFKNRKDAMHFEIK